MARPAELDPASVPDEPLPLFLEWYGEAERARIPLHNTMALATATPDGRPSVRMVLLKDADADGFVFYTNYESPKARELDTNPRAELLFYWNPIDRQVRVEGPVERVGEDEADAYFRTRPRGSQLSAWASRQSEPVESRRILEQRMAELASRYPEEVPRPPGWGGYRLRPERLEFWLSRDDRLHDRVLYERGPGGAWQRRRLSP
jgi:pyridoxamine 5'-phosphate oxidase